MVDPGIYWPSYMVGTGLYWISRHGHWDILDISGGPCDILDIICGGHWDVLDLCGGHWDILDTICGGP